MTQPSEAAGAEESVEDFFYANAARLVRFAHLLGADDPEDVVQDAFCRFLVARRRRPIERATAYLNTSIVNEVRSRQRHSAVVRRRQLHAVPEPAAHERAEANEAQSRLMIALGALAPRQREALVLRYWLDLPLAEIAVAMGVRVGTVKSLLSRGMVRLAEDLEEYR